MIDLETTTTTAAADLDEARRIVAELAAMREALPAGDRRLVDSWQSYLRRTGDAAAIGPHRLALLRGVLARVKTRPARADPKGGAFRAYKDAKDALDHEPT